MTSWLEWCITDICVPILSHHHFRNCPQTSAQPPPSGQAGRAQSEAEAGGGTCMTQSVTHFRCFGLRNLYKMGVADRRDRSGLEDEDVHQNKGLKPAIKVSFEYMYKYVNCELSRTLSRFC